MPKHSSLISTEKPALNINPKMPPPSSPKPIPIENCLMILLFGLSTIFSIIFLPLSCYFCLCVVLVDGLNDCGKFIVKFHRIDPRCPVGVIRHEWILKALLCVQQPH
mmetsp:Transcript_10770/g.31888  ORF Transcript_10770/g.31888 Transcript_10770/m.31888 type:complete len:107 (+) Transcript_10770:345-665(+)